MSISREILAAVTAALDSRKRELDSDQGLREVKLGLRRLRDGRWFVRLERATETEVDRVAGVVGNRG